MGQTGLLPPKLKTLSASSQIHQILKHPTLTLLCWIYRHVKDYIKLAGKTHIDVFEVVVSELSSKTNEVYF